MDRKWWGYLVCLFTSPAASLLYVHWYKLVTGSRSCINSCQHFGYHANIYQSLTCNYILFKGLSFKVTPGAISHAVFSTSPQLHGCLSMINTCALSYYKKLGGNLRLPDMDTSPPTVCPHTTHPSLPCARPHDRRGNTPVQFISQLISFITWNLHQWTNSDKLLR